MESNCHLIFTFILLIHILGSIFIWCNKAHVTIDKNSKQFIDNEGRIRIFHGVNIVVKNPPYTPIEDSFHPLDSLSQADYDYLVKFGFNVVRLGLIWEAVEVAPGVYNHTYLDVYEKIIDKLGERGIYTILDSHQDMFSRILCGEGVPIFYAKELMFKTECSANFFSSIMETLGACLSIKEKNIPSDENSIPLIEECKKQSFVKFHQSVELSSIYFSFFENINNIQDKFISYWKILAERFKDNKYIIGYDVWNEPWVGDLITNYKHLIPGYFTNKYFLPFYQKVEEELRKIDENYVLMFEEALFPDTLPFFGGIYLGGYEKTPGRHKHKQIWSTHYYCKGLSKEISELDFIPEEVAKTGCINFADYKIRKTKQKADELGVAVFFTEFGACQEGESCYYEIKGFADSCDKYLLSWAYWAYKPYGDHTTHCPDDTEGIWTKDGEIQNLKLKGLTRPYIMAFQGTPIKSFFYTMLDVFHSSFVFNEDIDDFSILYLNRDLFYGTNGFKLIFSSKEIGNNLIANYEISLYSSKEIENYSKNVLLSDWEDLNISKDHNYLKFKLIRIKEPGSDKKQIKKVAHEYLGFSSILHNTIELLVAPKATYYFEKLNQNDIETSSHFKNISIDLQDLSPFKTILNKYNLDNVILISIDKLISNSYFLIEYRKFDDIDNYESSTKFVKVLNANEKYILEQVYISKLSVRYFVKENLEMEIVLKNILNNYIHIKFYKENS